MRTITLILLLLYSSSLFAVAPQFWEKNTQQQFAEGDPQSISINSEAELVLAPQLKKLYDGTDPIIWKIVKDAKGNLYLATGNDGRVLKLDALTGKVSTYLDTTELEVHSLIAAPDGSLYAATSPDGKIYKVKPDGKSSVFFDPVDKYIWSLALDSSGFLYAGTGDEGKIYRIDGNGEGKLLIDTTENNITSLLWTEDRNLLGGSDRNGILYQVDLSGKAFVLSDSDLQQITSIYASPGGEVYFAAITGIVPAPGLRPPPELRTPQPTSPQPEPVPDTGTDEGEVTTTVEVVMPTQSYTPPPIARPTGASQLYRINPGGFVETVFTATEDQILDITGYGEDNLLLSTGKKAKLISVDPNKKSSILLKAPEEQMTSLLASEGKIWVATANPGNLYELVETHSSQGTYYSDIKDTQTISTWGQISWKGIVPPDSTLTIYTRSGNTKVPDETWSDWGSAGTNPEGAHVTNPRARFVQWKAEFTTKNPASTPVLRSVSLAYLQQNLRPEVLSITLHPPGVVYRKTPIYAQESFAGISETASTSQDSQEGSSPQQPAFDFGGGLGKREIRKGYQTLTWNAVDQNQDDLRYDVSYRSENDRAWKELTTNLKEKVFAWDTQTLPDGTYMIRVTANDSGSNPKEYVLNNSKESTPFDIDNSAPSIVVKESVRQEDKVVLVVQARDQFSSVRDMQYSITPGEWVVVFPVDSINDSLTEDYRIEVSKVPAGVDTIILRCSDRVRNTTTTKYRLPK